MANRFINRKTVIALVLIFAVASAGIFIGRWTVSSVDAEEAYEELRVFLRSVGNRHFSLNRPR